MKKLRLAGLGVAALALAGCSSAEPTTDPTAPGVEAATAESAASPDPTESISTRGNLVKEVGEPAGVTLPGQEDAPVVNFAVKGIQVDPACTSELAQAPEIGHFVVVDIEAETGSAAQFEEAFMGQDYQFNQNWWKFVDAQGTTANNIVSTPTYSCLPEAEALPMEIGPGERVTGKIVLDTPSTEGTLIFDDPISGNAWEWEIPAA